MADTTVTVMNMENTETKSPGILDRAFISFLKLDGEKIAWIILILVALLSRTIMLGARAMSHDESLHTVYSFQLYDGRGYQHQPMMHGPLKFILNPLMYFMFGVNDWSARIQVAIFGVVMVAVVWVMRRWIGRTGAFLTALMYTVSPALVYHSRYIRDEVMLTSLLVILVICLFRYLEERSLPWLVGTAVTLGFAFLTMEASFIFGGIFGIFLVLALTAQLWASVWPGENGASRRGSFRMLAGIALPLLVIGLVLEIFKQRVPGFILMGVGAVLAVLAALLALTQWRWSLRAFRELDLIVLLLTLVMPFLSAVVLKAVGWEISQFNNPGQITLSMVWQGLLVLAILFILSGVLGFLWLRERWFIAAGAFWVIEILFFTTFLTNGQGIGTGLIGSLGYWIDQQEVMRGGQPWYYFYLIVPLYEFLPWILSGIGMIAAIVWLVQRARGHAEVAEVVAPAVGQEMPAMGAQRVSALRPQVAPITVQELFIAFLVFWPTMTWLVFTYVGEKMPWHSVYMATSMAPLAGWWIGRVIDGIDWRGKVKSLVAIMVMVPLFLVALKAILPTSTNRPFSNVSVDGLSNTAQWLLGLIFALVLIYFLYDRFVAVGGGQAVRAVVTSLAALLLILTVGVSFRLNFVNYDYATEPIVYAHATPDIKLSLAQLEELSRKTAGDHAIRFSYDDDSTWPLEWYFRDYPNKVYFGGSPSRDAVDSPVVIVGDKNVSKVKPYLGDRYYEFNYRLIWWPRETYKGLNWQRIWDGIRDPVQRGQFWDVVIHRRYTTKTAQWDPIHRFSMFVRKDVAAQVWNWGAGQGSASTGEGSEAPTDPYAGAQKQIAAVQQLGVTGQPGTGPGQFNFPRAVAVDSQGNVYVADSGNNRIVVFGPDGAFLREWGSTCKLDTGEGCVNGGAGQFNEPWGIAVAPDGSVFVSDTWNHRIQKFTNDGQYVTSWGVFGSTGGELGQENLFYGPRAVVVGLDGNISVMDTGNKRVQVFKPDGTFVTQWGGGGVVDGRFDEPVGLAQDGDGRWYVADTWNKRIQRFNPVNEWEKSWPVNGWGSQSVVNKPSIAVDSERNTLYAVDPENFRVLAWNLDGQFKATWGLYGNDMQSFTLPTGIAVGPDGRVYVADGDSHRVMVFPPLE